MKKIRNKLSETLIETLFATLIVILCMLMPVLSVKIANNIVIRSKTTNPNFTYSNKSPANTKVTVSSGVTGSEIYVKLYESNGYYYED